MGRKRANGEGSLFQRPDGRWLGQASVRTIDGNTKRITVYGATRADANAKLSAKLERDRNGIRTPDHEPTVGEYLDFWLETLVRANTRPRTAGLYESRIRLYLKPHIGSIKLSQLTPSRVQQLVNDVYAATGKARTTEQVRGVLRAALNQAEREELVVRNAASKISLPRYERSAITPWTVDQLQRFLDSVRQHRYYGAFLLLGTYGARRGEVLGLTWKNVDFDAGRIRIDQQLQRLDGVLQLAPVKTSAGRRTLPMTDAIRTVLASLAPDELDGESLDPDGLVFQTPAGRPVDPQNFTGEFLRRSEAAGLPRIKLHHLRHTAATQMKRIGLPDRDIQQILGHANITTTQQIYQHGDAALQTAALNHLSAAVISPVAAPVAAFGEISTGQGAEIGALTPGGSGGARTLDILLKRQLDDPKNIAATPVSHAQQDSSEANQMHPGCSTGCSIRDHISSELAELAGAPHVSCGLGHSTEWLVRELLTRLDAADQEGRGDLAA